MTINFQFEGDKLCVALEGRLDSLTSQDLLKTLEEPMKKAKSIEFDFVGLEYISSAGLRALLTFQKQLGGKDKIVIKNSNPVVLNIFNVTGLAAVLTLV